MERAKAFVFDLDGVLIDSKLWHFESLNEALTQISPNFVISIEEHQEIFEGLSTKRKLEILTSSKGLPESTYSKIWQLKQDATLKKINQIKPDEDLIKVFKSIQTNNVKIAVASNSIQRTVSKTLINLGVMDYVELFLSNEDVISPKPNPEIYWETMKRLAVHPRDTVIFEDSPVGREAAITSGANLVEIYNRNDLTMEKIEKAFELLENSRQKLPWKNEKLNVLIPMAGSGTRFQQVGFTFPKPLIEVNGKPMIQVVVENLNLDARFIYVVQKTHYEEYNLKYLLNLITPGCQIVQVEDKTEGAACTSLLASKFIDNDQPLLIANSDQFIEWNCSEVLFGFQSDALDGGIVTFKSTHPKWSFVKIGESGFVSEVAEKKVISDQATAGIYFWKTGKEYVRYARQMIEKNIRTNGEFYIAPVFNEAIADGMKIRATRIERMWGLGTPEDLQSFLDYHKK
jgi:HAD superfamily hydrolase (TIGR01509 family)